MIFVSRFGTVNSSVNEKPSGRVVDDADMTAYAGNGIDGCSRRVERRTGGRVTWDLDDFDATGDATGDAIATGSHA